MNKNKLTGYVMASVGGLMILANALDYIFGWDTIQPAFGIMGIVFLGGGMATLRKSSN